MNREQLNQALREARAAFEAGALEYHGEDGLCIINGSPGLEPPPLPPELADVPPTKRSYTREERPTLEEAQAFVGGLVEVVELAAQGHMLINEEGRLTGLYLNRHASELAGVPIAGPAWILYGPARWE
jgi:hypothetical protein